MLYLILIALLPVVHELGHELTARKFGVPLRWSFEWGKIGSVPIPRFVFDFETDNATARKWIKLAGFLAEGAFAILAGLFLPVRGILPLVWFLHLALYRKCAGFVEQCIAVAFHHKQRH